jgi:hypothetical protein
VTFNPERGQVITSNYNYKYNKKNYLIIDDVFIHQEPKTNQIEDVSNPKQKGTQKSNNIKSEQKIQDVIHESTNKKQKPDLKLKHLLDSSTLFLKLDLKYFLTIEINHEDIESELIAYKNGPIRSITRVTFQYNILKLNFDLGMYTEISFFSNSVIFPAIIDNPIDGSKLLNDGSIFYYGFSLVDNPSNLLIDTNMPKYQNSSIFEYFSNKFSKNNRFWFTAAQEDFMIFINFNPSSKMIQAGNSPKFYKEDIPGSELAHRGNHKAPLGKSSVNFAISFDLTSLYKGLHNINLNLFIENQYDKVKLNEFKQLDQWIFKHKKI